MWDVFLSYSRSDADRVRPLADALRGAGLSVFTDEAGVASFAGISDTIRQELARSRVLLAYYSTGYPEREACQWELTAAYLAGLREGDPRRRVLVVNPEAAAAGGGAAHIHPVELRDSRHALYRPEDGQALAALVADVRRHLAGLEGAMPLGEPPRSARWSPGPRPSAAGGPLLGRLPQLWYVHSALHAHTAPLVTGRAAARTVQIRGMAGVGKTFLAQEYAQRFAAAHPGGVCWLDASDSSRYEDQLEELKAQLGSEDLYRYFEEQGQSFLYVVDGLPAGLSARDVLRHAAPHPLGHTLFTTRCRTYDGLATPVELAPLDRAQARFLVGEPLADAVGGHPYALELLGRAIRDGHQPAALHERLHAPGRSLLDVLAGEDVTASFVSGAGTGDSADVLRCAAAFHPLPLTVEDATTVLALADSTPEPVAHRHAVSGLSTLRARGLLAADGDGGWTLHPVTLHAWRHHDPAPSRTETLRNAVLRMLHGRRGAVTLASGRKEGAVPASSDSERMAAYDLQVELVTRIGFQELAPGTGSLREALASLKSLIDFTRQTLHAYNIALTEGAGARSAPASAESLAYDLVNRVIRPFTSLWHPALAAHEAARPADITPLAHEAAWTQAESMRAELALLRAPLMRIADGLGEISGADFGLSGLSEAG
ncbi:toll/interleukin-1 receptor domain-containing protein [Streptomyces sp. SID14478]|uniref:TIR domain-containing protein n=1 Tax=Streptomyces sp. SID14478 TaxID=2706073 RepID=UPI0013DF5BFA|nr:toll/interleukin-1 receptor domain-containing protein [Streptomyces sp. SID14478]